MFGASVVTFGLTLLLLTPTVTVGDDLLSKALKVYLGTLERYANTENDVVFLLDESGSIGEERFPQVKLFAKLTSQMLSVSADHSRVAVLTFGTYVRTHVNYIEHPYGNNMCSLLVEIDSIDYKDGGTDTNLALLEAEKILAQSRRRANKIIILFSDGESDSSPLFIASRLKKAGIIIFAVGVADVNVGEIHRVAFSLEHAYILDKFEHEYIVNIMKLLVKATSDAMDPARDPAQCDRLCGDGRDCCDTHAGCYCGTRSGLHECACQAGYHGTSGLRGHCHKCPRGTYKQEALNSGCTPCPPNATTDTEGSKSILDCKCETGYEKIGNFCSPVRCASLSVPDGGILIPSYCNNTFGSRCSLRCSEGYCPFDCSESSNLKKDGKFQVLPTRTCLENREWSGPEFHCEKKTCPVLRYPPNGKHNCTENGFTFGTVCSFHCDKGYELFGSESRTCGINSWTGRESTCRETFCDPLKTNDLLHVNRTRCSTEPMPYRSVCQYHCSEGYILLRRGRITDGVLTCGENRKWIGDYEDITCQDIEPPKIICPESIQTEAEPHKGLAEVEWDFPKVTDNVPHTVTRIREIEPKELQKSPRSTKIRPAYFFPIGLTKVVYEATDRAKLTSTCSFNIEVIDKEPPNCIKCPEDIEIFHNKRDAIPVMWDEPIFEDNSKKFSMQCSRKSGDRFGWGPAVSVHCVATDKSNNNASCSFSVKVKHYPCPFYDPPANGVVTCDTWSDGRLCSVFCHEGYQFATAGNKFQRTYFCQQVQTTGGKIIGQWGNFTSPRKYQMPWPDCSKIRKPRAINTAVGIKIGVDSCSKDSLKKFQEKFFKLELFRTDFFCPKDRGCAPENVNISCNPASERSEKSNKTEVLYRNKQDSIMQELSVNFNVTLIPENLYGELPINSSENAADEKIKTDLSSSPVLKKLETEIYDNAKEDYVVWPGSTPEVEYNATVICSVGQIRVNNTCVNCPTGAYKDDQNETCVVCPIATYQDEERQLSCKPCPVGFTTYEVKSKSPHDCKGPCQPGTYSQTYFEPCLSCPLNTFQDRSLRKDCRKCPEGLYTWRVGANDISDCVAPCKKGAFSDTGLELCSWCDIGTFQDKERQTNCTICPNRTTTRFMKAEHFEDCEEIDICSELQPCLHNATCIQRDKRYECQCPDGLRGRNCEINIDDCASSPCLNGGTCFDGLQNFTCLCLYGFDGHQCQTNLDDCDPNPCLNGGKCVDDVDAFECECLAGFDGKLCERNIYECISNPCFNGGTCFDMQNGFRCCCPAGFHGPKCEMEEEPCDTLICQNGGTCTSDEHEYAHWCECPPGFEGQLCETDIDDCLLHECQNGGLCIDGVGNATCACPERYTGPLCEDALLLEYTLSFPTASTANYVALNNAHRLYSVTVSFFMRTGLQDSASRATPISYSYKHGERLVDNALTLYDTNNFLLYLHGEKLPTSFSGNSDSSWCHYAITWEKLGGKWSFFVDGKSVASGQGVGEDEYMHPGTFVLGQEQDDVGSVFSLNEAFAGDITEFNVWDYALTADEIRKINSSCGNVGNVIPWFTVSQYVRGDVKIYDYADVCKTFKLSTPHMCLYLNETEENWCKHKVPACSTNTCANNQPCNSEEGMSFCECDEGFEGRRCEYDIDECLDANGGCDVICVNEVGSYHCECKGDLVLAEDGKTCKDTTYCVQHGQTYMNDYVWISNCQNCMCNRGIVECQDITCREITCKPDETRIIYPGQCCSKCVAMSFCIFSPNSTFVSFNASKYQIRSGMNFTALEDCIGGRFKVQMEFTDLQTYLVVHQDCSVFAVSSDGSVSIDGGAVDIPYSDGLWNVEWTNASVSVKTNTELVLHWDLRNDAALAVPVSRESQMCGLCQKLEDHYVFDNWKIRFIEQYPWAFPILIGIETKSLNLSRT